MDTLLNLVDEAKTSMTDQQYRNIVDKIAALRVEEEKKDRDLYRVLCVVPRIALNTRTPDEPGLEYELELSGRYFILPGAAVRELDLTPGCHRDFQRIHSACLSCHGEHDIYEFTVGKCVVNTLTIFVSTIEKI